MSKKQLEDLIAFIRWSINNKQDEGYILSNVIHDLVGIYKKDVGFWPRTAGFAKKEMQNAK